MPAATSLLRKAWYSLLGSSRRVARQSSFKVGFILLFVILFEGGLAWLFVSGFNFLDRLGGVGLMIIHRLFSLLFLGLGFMLVVSGTLTSYATMYRSDEIGFLVARPYTIGQIAVYKFLESCLLSSWAFFFIIVPFVGAYAFHEQMSVLLAVWTLVFSIPFVILCSGIGTMVTMILIRVLPSRDFVKASVMLFLIPIAVGAWLIFSSSPSESDASSVMLAPLVPGLRLSSYPLFPSWWVAEGIVSLGRAQWIRGTMLWGMLASSCLMICFLVEALGNAAFYEGWQRVLGSSGRRPGKRPLLNHLSRGLSFLPHDIRAMVLKDIRTFLRDPTQWTQFLIFFGLLGIYFASLRSLHYNELAAPWRIFIAFLNIFSVSTVLCSLASRFIYPQLSLEGQGFWILGLSPTTMGRILMTKFLLSLAGMSVISVGLMVLSTRMLQMAPALQALAIGIGAGIALAVSGMSTGLGAIHLDLQERNPSAIVSGFGGTLNLVLGLAFMLATLLPFAALFYLQACERISNHLFTGGMILLALWFVLLSVLAAVVPLTQGRRSLLARDY